MNHIKTSSLVGKFFYATLALMITLTSFPVAEKNIKKDINPAEISINESEQLAVKPAVQTDAVASSSKMIDVEKINQIRQDRMQSEKRLEGIQMRLKQQKQIKMREEILNRSIPKPREKREIPNIVNPFQFDRKSLYKIDSFTNIDRLNDNNSNRVKFGARGLFNNTDTLYVLINGVDADTITQGGDFVVTIYFSTGYTEADLTFWIDMDGNGILDTLVDLDVEDGEYIEDGDFEDETPSDDGVYQFTFYGDDEEGLQQMSNLGFFIEATDGGGSDVAYLYIEPEITDYSVSGVVTPAMANILVGAFPSRNDDGDQPDDEEDMPWMTVTNAAGLYQNFVPDSGEYEIFSFDFLDVTDGMFPDTFYTDVLVNGHLTGYDFNYIAPSAWIEGTVIDENSDPIEGIEVWADTDDGLETWTETDTNGFYSLGVIEDNWWVGVDDEDLIPDYLVPIEDSVYVSDGSTEIVNFTVYSADETISGMVFLDDMPFGEINLGAKSALGWTETHTHSNGSFVFSVSSAANAEGGYNIEIWDWLPPGVVIGDMPWGVMAGEFDVDIHLHTVLGGIEGILSDVQTGEPIEDGWVYAENDFGDFGIGTWDEGHYYLPLPNGVYDVFAGADDYYQQQVPNVIIQDNVIPLDFYLEPVIYDGTLSGYVYESGSTNPIIDAEVDVGNEDHWDHTHTDSTGFYHFDLPSDTFWVGSWKEGYTWDDTMIVIDNNDVTVDFLLQPIILDAAIEGVVFDDETGDPIIGAFVHAMSRFFDAETMTGVEGYFFMEVPSDTFWVEVFVEGYEPGFIELSVAPEETVSVEIGLLPQLVSSPVITSITDVPNDQGRQVRITWWAGDPSDYGIWKNFSIWRQVNGTDYLWDFITEIPFHGLEEYSYVAPTLIDSNATTGLTDEFWSVFMVTAHTFDPWTFFDSEPEWGYSVDNLAPHTPGGLFTNFTSEGIMSTWSPPMDEDFQYFAIYRTQGDGTEPELFATTTDTFFHDLDINWEAGYYEAFITAFDFNGNESDPSDHSVLNWLEIDEMVGTIPTEYTLYSNFPNPFNPSTTIQFDLPNDGIVLLSIYNLIGQEINTMVNREFLAGRYRFEWDGTNKAGKLVPSGVYLYRISVNGNEYIETRKMMLLR